jgi:hypothetical protein
MDRAMTQKFWIGVVARDHAMIAQDRGVCAFSHGKQAAVERLSHNDRFIFYCPKTGINEGDIVQAFCALGTVADDAVFEENWANTEFTAWVRKATYENVSEVPAKPMLDDLSFVPNPRYWGMAFRRGLFEISPEDFNLISGAMLK